MRHFEILYALNLYKNKQKNLFLFCKIINSYPIIASILGMTVKGGKGRSQKNERREFVFKFQKFYLSKINILKLFPRKKSWLIILNQSKKECWNKIAKLNTKLTDALQSLKPESLKLLFLLDRIYLHPYSMNELWNLLTCSFIKLGSWSLVYTKSKLPLHGHYMFLRQACWTMVSQNSVFG